MQKITPFKLLQTLIAILLFTCTTINAQVGINTDSPTYQFHMINSGTVTGGMAVFENNDTNGVSLSGFNTSTTNTFNGIEGSVNYTGTAFTPSGVLGLALYAGPINNPAVGVYGQTNDFQGVGVLGVRSNATGGANTGFAGLFLGTLGYSGGVVNLSDRKTKKGIEKINSALNMLIQLNPVKYQFNIEKYPFLGLNENTEYGFIAQELEKIIPTVVQEKILDVYSSKPKKLNQQYKPKHESFKMVNYVEIIPILTQGIKEQQSIIEDQNEKIKILENKLANLESKVNALINKKD